jgi:diamine N-acetyltransferase
MFLKGRSIYLRALEPSDADILYRWENDPEVWRVSFTQAPFSHFLLDEFVNAAHHDIYTNRQLRLMACANDGRPAGIIDLFDFDPQHNRCGIGIYINHEFRKQGFATQCLLLVKEYAFGVLHLRQLYAHVSTSNTASISLFRKAGFEQSGLKKSWYKTGHSSYDDVWFMQCFNPAT